MKRPPPSWARRLDSLLANVPEHIEDLAAWIDTQPPGRIHRIWIEAIASADCGPEKRLVHPAIGPVLAAVRRAYGRIPSLRYQRTRPRKNAAAPAAIIRTAATLRDHYQRNKRARRHGSVWEHPTTRALIAAHLAATGPRNAGQICNAAGAARNRRARHRLIEAIRQDPRFTIEPRPRGVRISLRRPAVDLTRPATASRFSATEQPAP